jgi:hypothetical protein
MQGRNDLAVAKDTALRLLEYCRANDWAGYDPYDALNSRVFKVLPVLDFKSARLVLTQVVKRSPINFRPVLGVAKSPNPKGISLFLSSLITLSRIGLIEGSEIVGLLADRLLALRSPDRRDYCWGYNFDWQTRGELVPRGSPNIICSTFAANALLDAYEYSRQSVLRQAAESAAEFILGTLFRRRNASEAFFTYTPLNREEIHNANLLGAAFLCRISRISGRAGFLEPALEAARYSVRRQGPNGSWPYGESPHYQWIDNFHTGYNLCALRRIAADGGTSEFDESIRAGFSFYRDHFFRRDGAPRYFHNATYPIDIHSVAQSIITLVAFDGSSKENTVLALSVLNWAMAHLWNRRGYFYFQKHPFHTVRIPFMRWSQAWMLKALADLLESGLEEEHD